mmetsp:Transcript_7599/g.8844  ORF Transcript_7599/g.8844 Transcript_7599/m.8844 type:complete len:117 (+) Transcript_7599:111-461(+)
MKSLLLSFLVVLILVPTTSSSGFTNAFGIVHSRWDREGYHLRKLLKDTHYTSQRLVFLPTNSKYSSPSKSKRQQQKKGKHDHHHVVPNGHDGTIKRMQSYYTHDEEILERLVELQN